MTRRGSWTRWQRKYQKNEREKERLYLFIGSKEGQRVDVDQPEADTWQSPQ